MFTLRATSILNLKQIIMKKQSAYALILGMLFLSITSFAQQARDSKGHLLLNAKGDVYVDGVKTGTVSNDRIIKDSHGKKLGFLSAGGILTDEHGKVMGKMGKDGKTYFDDHGNIVFTIEDFDKETCNIKDAKGVVIGNVHKSLKGIACALHCFQNQMDMKKHEKH
jgi:hypothetical protein